MLAKINVEKVLSCPRSLATVTNATTPANNGCNGTALLSKVPEIAYQKSCEPKSRARLIIKVMTRVAATKAAIDSPSSRARFAFNNEKEITNGRANCPKPEIVLKANAMMAGSFAAELATSWSMPLKVERAMVATAKTDAIPARAATNLNRSTGLRTLRVITPSSITRVCCASLLTGRYSH